MGKREIPKFEYFQNKKSVLDKIKKHFPLLLKSYNLVKKRKKTWSQEKSISHSTLH